MEFTYEDFQIIGQAAFLVATGWWIRGFFKK